VGWVLITLYMGPVALALYVLADKEPSPGTHEEFVQPLWKQGVGSTVHCIAGDASASSRRRGITGTVGLPMWNRSVVQSRRSPFRPVFIFQSLFVEGHRPAGRNPAPYAVSSSPEMACR